MHFFLDADLPRDVAEVVRNFGHDVTDCRDVGLGSAVDEEIFRYAQERGMALITGDYGFANLQTFPPSKHNGIVTLAIPRGVGRSYILTLVGEFLESLGPEADLAGCLAMVRPGRVRYRREP